MIYTKAFDSKRFCFVPIHQEHASELFEAVSHLLFPKSLLLAQIRTLEQAHHWCKERVSDWQSGKAFVWTCVDKANQSIIGQVTIQKRVNCLALSYWIIQSFGAEGMRQRCVVMFWCIYRSQGIKVSYGRVFITGIRAVAEF